MFYTFSASRVYTGNEITPPVESAVAKPEYYRNDYFGFSFLFSRRWTLVHRATPYELQAAGGDALVRDGILTRETVNADQRNTHTLLDITNPRDPYPDYLASITIVAEGIREGAPFKTGDEYIAHTARLLVAIRSPRYAVVEPAREVTLGGRKFFRAEFKA